MAELNLPEPGVTRGLQWAQMLNNAIREVADRPSVEVAGPVETGVVFWGVFAEGNEPTPPSDGRIHFGFRTPA